MKVVVVGGGTGVPRVLKALGAIGCESTAIVNVSDDGGSSGVLRDIFNHIPPGDIRNCLTSTAKNLDLAEIFNYRFDCKGWLNGHSLGNLILEALFEKSSNSLEAIEIARKLLNSPAFVLPATLDLVILKGLGKSKTEILGQHNIANTQGIEKVYYDTNPKALPAAIEKIGSADIIIIGPGSIYSSILPVLIIDEIANAISNSQAKKIYISNIINYRAESLGFDVDDYINAIFDNAKISFIDMIIANDGTRFGKEDLKKAGDFVTPVKLGKIHEDIDVIVDDTADNDIRYHDPKKLAEILKSYWLPHHGAE